MHRLSPASLWESRSLREALGRGWLAPSAQFVYCSGDRTRARASVATARKGTSSRRRVGVAESAGLEVSRRHLTLATSEWERLERKVF